MIAFGAWRDAKLVGLLVLAVRRLAVVRIAEMVGGEAPSYLGLLADAGHPDVAAAMAAHCAEQAAFDAFLNENLSDRDAETLRFLECLEQAGYTLRRTDRAPCWWMRLEPTDTRIR